MRMHSACGKFSPNLIVGALLVFSVIVLYNYWTVSTVNRDLLLRLHTLEQQVITLSRAKDSLQESIDKAQEEKSGLQLSLHQEEAQETDLKQKLQERDGSIKDLQNELEHAKKSLQTVHEEYTSKKDASQKEIRDLKDKVVSLDAQIAEKTSANEELQEQFDSMKKSLEKAEKLIEKLKMSSTSPKSIIKADDPLAQPVLISDQAVPYPDGWMDPQFSQKNRGVRLNDEVVGLKGASSYGQVIIFDNPSAKKAKARFSVLDPPKPGSIYYRPEQQMNPEVASGLSPSKSDKLQGDLNGGEQPVEGRENNQDGVGVLPIPGGGGGAENLDAAEDDGDHPLKDDNGNDQSPDGTLSAKEIKDSALGVGPAPPPGKGDLTPELIPGPGGHSGQDIREAAHLPDPNLHNTL